MAGEIKNTDNNKVVDSGEKGTSKESADGGKARKTISPYDITPNDNPGSLVTQVQLKGENYDEWASSLRTALRARKKFGFVDGTIKKPDEDSPDLEDWWTNNSLLVSWIMNTIEPSVRSTMSHMEVAHDLWEDIKERFSVVNGPRIQQLKAELADCKQKGSTILAYFGKMKKLWEELANYEQIPSCKCGKCTCNIGVVLQKKREEERVHQFLMGLDDTSYGTVRSNLLTQDPLPALNRVYSVLVQEERVRTITRGKEDTGEVMSFAVQARNQTRGRSEGPSKTTPCSHCNRPGHEPDGCFELIGYPDWWGERPRGARQGAKRGKEGMTVGGRGRGGRGGPIKANVMQTVSNNTAENVNSLSNEQWEVLLNLVRNVQTGATEKLTGKHISMKWIIDTGATHHMTGQLNCLSNVQDVKHCPVNLPNGKHLIATKEGTMVLCDSLSLTNFTKQFCAIQDPMSRMLIGVGEQKEGLYYFQKMGAATVMQAGEVVAYPIELVMYA
ncbi:hypothetical protein L195_g039513 [Trifolium pratense]|uniref:Retrotransposon Copia-like N-terminal domain-containing protein n=1 Tax=Trifolium pratense TaxID=57577 RepID=A0A2K3LY56_TRIPR|nr:hypothetical protein L195_g039513 [Trifolium pratense]